MHGEREKQRRLAEWARQGKTEDRGLDLFPVAAYLPFPSFSYSMPVCASTKSGLVTWNSLRHTHPQREATKSGQVKGERGW